MFWRWVLVAVMIVLGLMYVNAAVSCFWAAGSPRNLDPDSWIRCGYIDLAAAGLLLLGAVIMLIKNIKRARKDRQKE